MIPPVPPQVDARIFQPVLDRMPDPAGQTEAAALEVELASGFGVAHAVTVSSGTAALHTALVACGIGAGDEVLLSAATVMMTVAAVTEAEAHPVFVEAAPGGGMNLEDLRAKITPRTRAILPVHLHGRCDGIGELATLARQHNLMLIEDACQAQGSCYRGQLAGTFGDVGCFSLKDGKIYAAGEGGYLLTDNLVVAERAAAYRTHWAIGIPGMPAGIRLGRNYRLPELSARLARHRLSDFHAALARRRTQAALLIDAVSESPWLEVIAPGMQEGPNGYSPLWRIRLAESRAFARHLADAGVPNSVGTFGLRAASAHPACRALNPAPCPATEHLLDHLLAVVLNTNDTEADLRTRARIIQREALAWTVRTT